MCVRLFNRLIREFNYKYKSCNPYWLKSNFIEFDIQCLDQRKCHRKCQRKYQASIGKMNYWINELILAKCLSIHDLIWKLFKSIVSISRLRAIAIDDYYLISQWRTSLAQFIEKLWNSLAISCRVLLLLLIDCCFS